MADKDNRIWLLSNPETLGGIERHIRVKAFADLAQGQIRIVSVSAITEGQAGARLHDAAFRRQSRSSGRVGRYGGSLV